MRYTRLKSGQKAPSFTMDDVEDRLINLADFKGKKVYLAFLRNTQCPLCNFHLYKITRICPDLRKDNLEVIVFYESKKTMFRNSTFYEDNVLKERKLIIISDPERKIYDLYGAEVDPNKATMEILKKNGRLADVEGASKIGITGNGQEEGTNAAAIPADFFLDEEGVIQYAHYGKDAGDHTDPKDIEEFARSGRVPELK